MDIDQDDHMNLYGQILTFRWVEWRAIAKEAKQRKATKMRTLLEKEVKEEIKINEEITEAMLEERKEYERRERVRREKWRKKPRPPDPLTAGKKRVRDEYDIHVTVPEVEERLAKKVSSNKRR
jgi:hypothetical protein